MRHIVLLMLALSVALGAGGCITAREHLGDVQNTDADRLTVGKVQREIRVGMTTANVIEVLGSPNIVSTDEQRREVWVYDKIATETAYSTSSGGVSALILGGLVDPVSNLGGGGGLGGSFSRGAGASSTTQRTLTIIIKFDEQSKVRDFAYRQSSF